MARQTTPPGARHERFLPDPATRGRIPIDIYVGEIGVSRRCRGEGKVVCRVVLFGLYRCGQIKTETETLLRDRVRTSKYRDRRCFFFHRVFTRFVCTIFCKLQMENFIGQLVCFACRVLCIEFMIRVICGQLDEQWYTHTALRWKILFQYKWTLLCTSHNLA